MKSSLTLDERVDRAVDNFMAGYGCCQSVVAAFSDLYGLDETMAKRIAGDRRDVVTIRGTGPLLQKHLGTFIAPTITFDKLDAFTATSGMHIINLTATEVPQSFLAVVQAIRSDFKSAGCVINSEFRLHVTLGRVKDPHVQLPRLQKMLEAISLPAFSLTLTDVDYRVFRSRTIYETKLSLD